MLDPRTGEGWNVMTGQSKRPRVVVGVDGSDQSQKALDWAADYVQHYDGSLDVVGVWAQSAAYGMPPMVVVAYDPEPGTRVVVDKALASVSLPDDQVRGHVLYGHAGRVLVACSEGADLLVVGSHGHGFLAGALLGSVSKHCLHHSKASVVVVR